MPSVVKAEAAPVTPARSTVVGGLLPDDTGELGDRLISPEISRRPQASVAPHKLLTDLDARILEGVAAGKSTVSLAAKLHLSRQGIEYHISAMFVRFKVSNRTALASKAYTMGLLSVNYWPPQVPADWRHST